MKRMEAHETVLSDVHLLTHNEPKAIIQTSTFSLRVCTSRLIFKENSEVKSKKCTVDEDGDLEVARTAQSDVDDCDVIILEHSLATPLTHVGLQVWAGAMLLADYILNEGRQFVDCRVLELGSGTGFVSVLLGMYARSTFCTDVGDEVLQMCQRNIDLNQRLLGIRSCDKDAYILTRQLNWLDNDPLTTSGTWSWQPNDLKILNETNFFFASDVIYDNNLTDAFFTTVQLLMTNHQSSTLYLSLEKRLNFTLAEMDVACPAYTHFEDWMQRLRNSPSLHGTWTITQLPILFHQYFSYDRSQYLELWKLKWENINRGESSKQS